MKTRLIFAFALMSCLAFTAISCDDDKDSNKSKQPACDINTQLTCASQTAKNVCKEGDIVAEPCDENQECKDNVCQPKNTSEKVACDQSTVLKCASDKKKTKCEGGFIEEVECTGNEVCKDNNCAAPSEKVACDQSTVLKCASDKKKTKCEGGFIEEVECTGNEVCTDNNCVVPERENLVGDTCTVDVCYKNIPHYCEKSSHKLFITDKEDPSCGENAVCEVTDEINAFCLESCQTAGSTKFVCGQNQIQQYSAEAVCTQFPDGKLALYVDESDVDKTEFCDEECIDGHCLDQKPTTADKDQPCDRATYGYHCDDNKLVFCSYYSRVDVSDCENFDKVCRTDASNSKNSACVVDNDFCDNPGNITYSCREEDEEYDFETLLINECVKATDDQNYKFVDSKKCNIGSCTAEGACTDY